MKIKRIIVMVLAIAMFLSIAGTASAAQNDGFPRCYWTQSNMGLKQQGSSGGSVRGLQQYLKMRGHLADSVDGAFGANTKGAVVAYQTKNGLTADGVVGSGTWTKMFGQMFIYTSYASNVLWSVSGKVSPWSTSQDFRYHHSNTGTWYVFWGNATGTRNGPVLMAN